MGLTNNVQPYCMFESMTVHATIMTSCSQRLIGFSPSDGVMRLGPCLLAKIRHCGVQAVCAVRHVKEREPHFDAGERASEHQLVHTAQVPNAEYATRNLTEARPERHIETVQYQRAKPGLVKSVGQT